MLCPRFCSPHFGGKHRSVVHCWLGLKNVTKVSRISAASGLKNVTKVSRISAASRIILGRPDRSLSAIGRVPSFSDLGSGMSSGTLPLPSPRVGSNALPFLGRPDRSLSAIGRVPSFCDLGSRMLSGTLPLPSPRVGSNALPSLKLSLWLVPAASWFESLSPGWKPDTTPQCHRC